MSSPYAMGYADGAGAMRKQVEILQEETKQLSVAADIFKKQVHKVREQRDEANDRILELERKPGSKVPAQDDIDCDTCCKWGGCETRKLKGITGCHEWEEQKVEPMGGFEFCYLAGSTSVQIDGKPVLVSQLGEDLLFFRFWARKLAKAVHGFPRLGIPLSLLDEDHPNE